MMDIDKYGEVDVTSAESSALARLSENKDFAVLIAVMNRWQMKRAYDLISARVVGQETDLIDHQGGYALLKRMIKYVQEAVDTTPKKRNG